MGLLKEPRERKPGLAGKRGPTVFEKVVKWKKAPPSKFQKALQKEAKGAARETRKFFKEIYKGDY